MSTSFRCSRFQIFFKKRRHWFAVMDTYGIQDVAPLAFNPSASYTYPSSALTPQLTPCTMSLSSHFHHHLSMPSHEGFQSVS